MKNSPPTRLLTALCAVVSCLLASLWLIAAGPTPVVPVAAPGPATGTKPLAADEPRVLVKLVTDLDSAQLASDLDELKPITETRFGKDGSQTVTLGEEAILWVRNAHIDGRFFFERYYQGKYIGRQSQLDIPLKELGPGEHSIQPGGHRFTVNPNGSLTSADPDIRITDNTLLLRLHRITVYAVDGARSGPPAFRKIAAELGLFAVPPEFKLDPAKLPNPKVTFEPAKATGKETAVPPLATVLSNQAKFYPLHVWLPANQSGHGYLLYPSWQAFHVTPAGVVDMKGAGAPTVAGVTADAATIVLPYRQFRGAITKGSRLTAGVASEAVQDRKPELLLSATLEPLLFRAGIEKPAEDFALQVDNDFSRNPYKSFVADNTATDRHAIRLLALEWPTPVFEKGAESALSLRLLETPGKETLKTPEARMACSEYRPSLPTYRNWHPVQVLNWKNERTAGPLRFKVPDLPPGFCVFRVAVADKTDQNPDGPLAAEIQAYITEPAQNGSASFVSPKGRNAFVAGETVLLQLVLRSAAERAIGARTVVLTHPGGQTEEFAVQDPGGRWATRPLLLKGEQTVNLSPGRYTLNVKGLPAGMTCTPFVFDLAGRDPASSFLVVKPSKYTKAMNDLEVSHLQNEPVDLDRAMRSIAEMGYTRVDLMTYVTNHHLRAYTWRENAAAADARLPAPESVFTPTPRDQILNACVREGLQYSDVWLTYNDFWLPRYIDPYISACERWLAREVQAMRHSPAWDGMMLYDEMYNNAAVAMVDMHVNLFPRLRAKQIADQLGKSPTQIESLFSKYLQRPKDQRDPETLKLMLRYRDWEQHGWADFCDRVVKVGKSITPQARFGTYHRTWLLPGTNDDNYNGYPPDLFRKLDIIGHVHYADNSTCWVSIPILAQILRQGNKPLYINLPLTHESRTAWDGQYQRHMAFALLQQGAGGISHWGLPLTFEDGANPGTVQSRETTRHLNREILQPFGDTLWRCRDGYRRIGIVSTVNQHSLSQFKEVAVGNQTEGLWIACWRLGYPATFLRESDFAQKLDGYSVIFVPGIRYPGELDEKIVQRLREAQAAGTRIVVEQGSAFEMPGLTRMDDEPLTSYYLGNYFPTWLDDELKKVYEKSQPIVDRLRGKFAEWDVEPAARGEFRVGPTWRSSGDINYLIMANFEDPDYGHAVKQQMAKPVLMPLQLPARYGSAAYDLMAQAPIATAAAKDAKGRAETGITVDMRRLQGGVVAFLPEAVQTFRITCATSPNPSRVRVTGSLTGVSGKPIAGLFPVAISIGDGPAARLFHRTLGTGTAAELDLPLGHAATACKVTATERLTGRSATVSVSLPARSGATLATPAADAVFVPKPDEVQAFLKNNRTVVIVPAPAIADSTTVAQELAKRFKASGIEAKIVEESKAFHLPAGNPELEDTLMDGFHSWRQGQEIIGPATVVDAPTVLLGGRNSSFLVDTLALYGYLLYPPAGTPGQSAQVSLQVARLAFHFKYDTLCVLANDAAGLRRGTEQLFAALPAAPALGAPQFGTPTAAESATPTPTVAPAPVTFTNTNEGVHDLQFDKAGNAYVITWGHGKNLYSVAPDGKLRFSLFLPEMGANRLQVADDRVLVHTACGARVYQVTLDGKPISQMRLNMDPGTIWDDEYELAYTHFQYVPQRQALLHNAGDYMRLIDNDANIVAEWRGVDFTDKDVSDERLNRETGAFVISPDGQRLAQLETSYYYTSYGDKKDVKILDAHLVIRDFAGKLLAEYKNLENGKELAARLAWPTGAPGPIASVGQERFTFDPDLKLLTRQIVPAADYALGDERRLVCTGRLLAYYDSAEHVQCTLGPFEIWPTTVAQNPDHSLIATLDEYGAATVFKTADGAAVARFTTPELGRALRFTPDGKRLMLGTLRGKVLAYDVDGKPAWQADLAAANDILGTPLPLFDPAIRDLTPKLWPVSTDTPAEIDGLARLAENRLVNGDAESEGGWQGTAAYQAEGYGSGSRRSLKVRDAMVSQEVTGYLGEHATWVLEFYYKTASPAAPARLLAGILAENEAPDSVARDWACTPEWQFARMAMKSGRNCRKLTVGFSASAGGALVDQIQFRRIRFPSINHMLYEPFFGIKPVVLDNPLYSAKYDPAGNLREQAPNRIVVEAIRTGALNLIESVFLQNGRLNDAGNKWYLQPLSHDPMVSLGLKEPRWVSMVGLYFNSGDPRHVAPHFDIYATNLETRKDELVARVRHNGQVFRLVKFPPVKTPLVRVRFVNSIARLRPLCELELYGPLSGREGTTGFLDPEGQNSYMGDFTRVDRRPKALAARYAPPLTRNLGHVVDTVWNVVNTQVLAGDGRFYISRAGGKNTAFSLDKPAEELYWGRAGGLGYTPYGALYGGLLLRNGLDGKAYCLNPDSGNALWSVPLGTRLFGAMVALGEDVFVANETGRLVQLDLANGGIMRETQLSGGVFGCLAAADNGLYAISDDGFLQRIQPSDLKPVWKLALAPATDSTPAVDKGVVFLADQKGTAMAVGATDGKLLWKTELGDEFTRCPVVGPAHVIFGCRGGTLAVLNRADGKPAWTRKVPSRFSYEPLLFDDGRFLYFNGGAAMLVAIRDGKEVPLQYQPPPNAQKKEQEPVNFAPGEPMMPLSFYKGAIFMVPRDDHEGLQMNYAWHPTGGRYVMLPPWVEKTEKKP